MNGTGMQKMKLILVEGLPGSGKSTTAHLLTRQLRLQGYDARWYYEQQTPHPLPYRAAQGVSEFVQASLHDWRRLARQASEEEGITVLESSFFQHALLELLAHDVDARTLDAYLGARQELLERLEPKLIFLHREDVAAAANEVCRARGESWQEHFVRVATHNPYSRRHDLTGLAGATEFMRRYQDLCGRVLGRLELEYLTVALPVADRERAQAQMLDFLGVAHLSEPELPAAQARELCGSYRDEPLDLSLTVRFEAGQLLVDRIWWPQTHFTPLLLNERTYFEVRGSPLELEFEVQPEGPMGGLGVRVGGAWEGCPGAGTPAGTVLVRHP
jgi:hypothetical protein